MDRFVLPVLLWHRLPGPRAACIGIVTSRTRTSFRGDSGFRIAACAVGFCFVIPCLTGCGTNKFQQELLIEEAAVKLARETADGGYQVATTADVRQAIEDGDPLLIVDAMPAEDSYDKGHLPGAVNFEFPKDPIDEWSEETMGARQQSEYEALLGDDKQRKIIVYCGYVKCARSHNAAIFAQRLGYTNVHRYAGGVYAWKGAGLELVAE